MIKSATKLIHALILLAGLSQTASAAELAGISVADEITAANQQTLVLNGMGLREKLWVDVYVGSLYLPSKANTTEDVLAQDGAMRIQMDFVYKKVESIKLIKAWKEGFEKNQTPETLTGLLDRIEQFYGYFAEDAVKGDVYVLDYVPEQGTAVSKNGQLLGTIEGADFKNALIEIWLGKKPADKGLKKGMLGK